MTDSTDDTSAPAGGGIPSGAPTADAAEPIQAQKKPSERRYEPQSVEDLLGAFYRGKIKAVSESTVRRLKSIGLHLNAGSRGELRRMAFELDESLDKSRRLMVVASEIPDLKALGHVLMDFAAEVVVFHPRLRRNGLQAHLFPVHWEDNDLTGAWEFLQEDECEQPLSAPELASEGSQPQGSLGKSKASSEKSTASKLRRNALVCSVLWRVSRGAPFAEAMRGLRSSIYKLPTWPPTLERDLLEAVALMQDKEDGRVALLLEWQARQQMELGGRLEQAIRQAKELEELLQATERSRDDALQACKRLEATLDAVNDKKEQLTAKLGVVQTHGKADFEELRAMALRLVSETARKLEEASRALGREQPKVVLARETLNVVVDALHSGRRKLEEAE